MVPSSASSYRGGRLLLLASSLLLQQQHAVVHAIDIYRVSDPVPADEDREARNIRVSGDGRFFAYETDADYSKSGKAEFADGVWNIWKTDMSSVIGNDNLAASAYITTKTHSLLSSPTKPSDKDAKYVALDYTGKRACFSSNVPGEESIMLSEYDPAVGAHVITYITNLTATPKRDAWWCDISSDGKTIVFNSDADLIPGVPVAYRSDQIYMTKDDGKSFTMVSPPELATQSAFKNQGAVVSGDGNIVAFRSTMQNPKFSESAVRDEAYMYRVEDEKLERITNFKPQECDVDIIYAKMVEKWTQANLTAAGVTKASRASCAYAATQGWIPAAGTVGMSGGNQPKMSDDGRFVAYASNFNPANTAGTNEDYPQVVSAGNLFLYDSLLGFTWQITKEGTPGPKLNADIEAFCCPGASAQSQRGRCSLALEMKGSCCWQRPCWFPALNAYVSGDGNSIGLVGDLSHDGRSKALSRDLEIFHYHVPTNTFTPVTLTDDASHDDLFPSLNYDGSIVAFTSDFDYSTGTPIIATNQVFAAKLAMGCSRDTKASNYMANPDVDVCCEYASDTLESPVGAGVNAIFYMMGEYTDMVERSVMTPPGQNKADTWCDAYKEQIRHDVACSMKLPHQYVTVSADTASCDTYDDLGIAVTLKIITTKSTPLSVLQSRLTSKYEHTGSTLWKAYLTKTMDDFLGPVLEEIEANIVNLASSAGIFNTLLAAAEIAGLVDTLNSAGPFTIFAPTDIAFSDVRDLDAIIADPARLKTLLLNHVVSGTAMAGDLSQGQRFVAAGGETLQVYKTSDGAVMINDSNVVVADIVATNGVIHVIDDVLEFMRDGRAYCPGFKFDDDCNCRQDDDCYDYFYDRCSCADAKSSTCCNGFTPPKPVLGIATDAGNFKTLLAAVEAARLTELLGREDITLFAPTDEAFAKITNLDDILADRDALVQLLQNHVVLRKVESSSLGNNYSIPSAGGALLKVTITDGKVMINNAQVITADIKAFNGIIHVIDEVLNFDAESSEDEVVVVKEAVQDAPTSSPTKAQTKAPTKKEETSPATTAATYMSSVIFGIVALLFFL